MLERAATAARLTLDLRQPAIVPRATGVDGALGRVLAVVYAAMQDGTFGRLKACRNHDCRWAFYDYSKNRSASWCSMQLCGTGQRRARTGAGTRPGTRSRLGAGQTRRSVLLQATLCAPQSSMKIGPDTASSGTVK